MNSPFRRNFAVLTQTRSDLRNVRARFRFCSRGCGSSREFGRSRDSEVRGKGNSYPSQVVSRAVFVCAVIPMDWLSKGPAAYGALGGQGRLKELGEEGFG